MQTINKLLVCGLAIALLLPAGVAPAHGRDITLAESGQTRYRVVIGQDAKAPVWAAAEELAKHLQQITGAQFRIVGDDLPPLPREILVGPSSRLAALSTPLDAEALGPQSYAIRTDAERLVIVGGPQNGTLNGVYVLLEDILGCRWYAPGSSVIPHQPTLRIQPLDVQATPPFAARVLLEAMGTPTADVDWSARMRLNGVVRGNDPRHQDVLHWAGCSFGHSRWGAVSVRRVLSRVNKRGLVRGAI